MVEANKYGEFRSISHLSSVASSRPYQGGNRVFIGVFALVVRERSDGSRTKVWRKSDEFYFVKSTLIP